ncbi:MAG: 50S ribosomal protein L30 [Nitrososphaeraceae archaeon]|jgi:large subunit ribosomal protein L30|nr:50S ribosomal protein L30 [Nitrososphaeraceae archaeon]MDW0175746.1 50S ribosomal protein L30 [Nitrososphaeraceae archaeon]MDW0180284.1 50S ribosomal protein L30 [Nitrososphaeraceae archaeon]MDW0188086.1 50S ribosomal protein L30 [Nitrososphaeraceae archaeon]MDW0191018.1 50S ribosomal protein L30 [Nitrososphaeraceae archaeon]
MAFLVVRMRGTVNVPFWALTTLKNLYLNKKFSATLVPENSDYLGMLRKINQWVAWSKADSEIVKTLIEKRGKKKTPKLDAQKESERKDEYKGIDELVNVIVNDKIKFSDQNSIKPWFSLNPPKGGFKRKSKKQFSDGGILGNNKDLLEIVKRMV